MIRNTFLKSLPVFGLATSFSLFTLLSSGQAQITVPQELVYEGRMLSTTGEVLQGAYTVRFSFWTDSDYTVFDVNEDGSLNHTAESFAGWQEECPVDFDDQGYFSVILGQKNTLAELNFEKYKYLQIEIKLSSDPDSAYTLLDINGESGQDTIDRKMIASVPYARHAEVSGSSAGIRFVLDPEGSAQASGENIGLQFGGNLYQYLEYNPSTSVFELSDSLSIEGGLTLLDDIELVDGATVDGVDISALADQVSQNASDILDHIALLALQQNRITLLEYESIENAVLILQNMQSITDLEVQIVNNAVQILQQAEAITQVQIDIVENSVNIASHTTQIHNLQQDFQMFEDHTARTFDDLRGQIDVSEKSTPGDFLLDSDNSGGNITLQFGEVLGETLQWNAFTNMFELSDDLFVDGNIQTTGTVNGVNLSLLNTQVEHNTTQIESNTSVLQDHSDILVQVQQDIAHNSYDIDTLHTNYSSIENTVQTLQNTTATHSNSITTLEQNVSNNTVSLQQIHQDITSHSDTLTTLEIITAQLQSDFIDTKNDILNLQISVLENTNTITQAEAEVLQNAADILSNTQSLQVIDQNVVNNAVLIAQNSTELQNISADVQVNAQDILQNASDIFANAQGLSQAQQDIIDNAQVIAKNASDILTNVQHIIELKAEQVSQGNDITQLRIDTSANTVFIENLQTYTAELEESIFSAQQDRIQMNLAIANNTTTLQQHSQSLNRIEFNLSEVENKAGSAEYSSENIITNGQTLTEAISSLDAHLGNPQSKVLQIPLGTASLRADGTDNKINVYQSTEQSGNNPNHYYKVFSKQSSLQDIETEFKILLPSDLQDVQGIGISYQTQGGIDDARVDISLTDEYGNIGFELFGLSSLDWARATPVLQTDFEPEGAEYVFLTIKAHSKESQQVRFGDIVLFYNVR